MRSEELRHGQLAERLYLAIEYQKSTELTSRNSIPSKNLGRQVAVQLRGLRV